MRLVFILILFATTAQAQFVINPYAFAGAGAAVLNAYANEKSIDLDGSAEYVSVDDDNSLSFGDGSTDSPFSLSAWVYINDRANSTVMGKYIFATGNYEYYLGTGGAGKLQWICRDKSEVSCWIMRQTINILTEGQWIHVVGTYDGSSTNAGLKIYINGVEEATTDNSNNEVNYVAMENTAADFRIGWTYSDTYVMDGKIDQVAIWDTVLSVDEIKEAMAIRDYNYHSRAANLVSWWDFDNDTTTTDGITDLIGTNHGTMQSGEYADLNTHVTWPYTYQLDSNAVWDSITPMQYAFTDSIHGGFSWLLDGSNEYISFGDIDAFSFTDGAGTDEPFSVCAWTNWETDNTMWHVSKDDDVNNIREWTLYRSAIEDAFAFRLDDGTDNHRITSYSNAHDLNQWLHVCATYNGGEDTSDIEIYVNGVEDKASNGAAGTYTGMSNTATEFAIGREDGGLYYTDGNISDVIIFDRVITAAEVAAVYNNHEPRDETKYDLSANIIGYWRGYNSTNTASGVLDQSGNGNNGTPTNTDDADFAYDYPREVLDSTGSFDFDGVDEYIDMGDNANLEFTTDVSIFAWVKADNVAYPAYFYGKYAPSQWEIIMRINDDSPRSSEFSVAISNTATGSTKKSYYGNTTGLNDERWHHVGFTWGNSTLKLYVDGQDDAPYTKSTDNVMSTIYNGTAKAMIGALDDGAGGANSNFYGNVSHVTIVDRALTDGEIQELYNDGSPVDITKVTFAADVVSHWRLDQTDDPTGTVTDIVGTNDGTATNMEAGDLKTDTYPTN